jgi:hypothetical protein
MTTRKNKSVRFSESESQGINKLANKLGIKPSVIVQKAVTFFLSEYEQRGPAILESASRSEAIQDSPSPSSLGATDAESTSSLNRMLASKEARRASQAASRKHASKI